MKYRLINRSFDYLNFPVKSVVSLPALDFEIFSWPCQTPVIKSPYSVRLSFVSQIIVKQSISPRRSSFAKFDIQSDFALFELSIKVVLRSLRYRFKTTKTWWLVTLRSQPCLLEQFRSFAGVSIHLSNRALNRSGSIV